MKKRIDFDEVKETRSENIIEKTLKAEFEVPEAVKAAQQEAFEMIRNHILQENVHIEEFNTQSTGGSNMSDSEDHVEFKDNDSGLSNSNMSGLDFWKSENEEMFLMDKMVNIRRKGRKNKGIKAFYKAATGMAAAAAVFSVICITNPALASTVPLVGNIFKEIGTSLGFSGDFSEYAKPLAEDAQGDGSSTKSDEALADIQGDDSSTVSDTQKNAESGKVDSIFSKTVDGVTVTLSEVYCNDIALYLSLLVESEEPIPDTMMEGDTPWISLNESSAYFSYNPEYEVFLGTGLDGKFLDEHTYAAVLRLDMQDTCYDQAGYSEFIEARDEFLKEKGFDMDSIDFTDTVFDDIAEALGMESFTDENFAGVGGPDVKNYMKEIVVPEKFTVDLNIGGFIGLLPEEQQTIPEMPEQFKREYNQEMAEYGLDENNYENFTEEEKEIEYRLYNEMWKKYYELYPERLNESYDPYVEWQWKGNWKFTFDVEKDTAKTVKKELNLLDEKGNGIISITKTPFEIYVEDSDPECKYFPVVLDAKGDLMDGGKFGGYVNVLAISDRDVSKVYVYLCDYMEYMDELKGYYWSDDYEENKKTKTFKQLLDERSLLHTEVVF